VSEDLRKTRIAKIGVAKVGNSRLGQIPIVRDRDSKNAGSGYLLYYGHKSVEVDETGLGHTEVNS
jgi:hypothetical protein